MYPAGDPNNFKVMYHDPRLPNSHGGFPQFSLATYVPKAQPARVYGGHEYPDGPFQSPQNPNPTASATGTWSGVITTVAFASGSTGTS